MKTKEEKLEALKVFLKENNITFEENHYSKSFKVLMNLVIRNLGIAVFFSQGSREEDAVIIRKQNKQGIPLLVIYNPFFIRDNETEEFTIEKMQNCIVNRMVCMQKKWQKQQRKDESKRNNSDN